LIDAAAWFSEVPLNNGPLTHKLLNKNDADLLPIQKASGISLDTQGGFLVPEAITNQIIQYRDAAGVMRREATTWTIRRGDLMNVPRRTNAMTTAFLAENTGFTESNLTFDSVSLSPKKCGAFVRLSPNSADLFGYPFDQQ
jgi:HK97 family phage major capsid protein